MDDLFGFVFVIIAIVLALTSKANKAKQQQAKRSFPQPAVQKPVQPVQPHPAPIQTPAWDDEDEEDEDKEGLEDMESAPAAAPLQPRVQTTVHATEHDHTGMFEGSMHAEETEGEDPCHDGLLGAELPSKYSDRIINESLEAEDQPLQAAQPGLSMDWSDSQGLVKAFVMQEVLKRPGDRRR